jgi:hypothetical protein
MNNSVNFNKSTIKPKKPKDDNRKDRRIPFTHVIRYSYPSLNSERHERLYNYLRELRDSNRFIDFVFSKLSTIKMLENFLSPNKTWGTTEDISTGGLCLVIPQKFEVGKELLIFDERLSHKALPAKIRWCSEYSGNLYKIGLEYNTKT